MVLTDHHGDGRFAIWCAAREGSGDALEADPERFFVPPYVGHRGWLGVRLDRGLDWDELAGIVEDAYAEVAPPKLVEAARSAQPEGRAGARRDGSGRGEVALHVVPGVAGGVQPPPVLLPSLDRLSELIERVVALLDQVALAPEQKPREPPSEEVVVPRHHPGPVADGWVAFVASPDGYRLLERLRARHPPGGAVLELDGDAFVVLRLGPSPLPGDRRRCAFLERKEPPSAERTFDR